VKVIQVCPRYYPNAGGVETHVKEISERLVRDGFEVEVVCTDLVGKLKGEEEINGVRVKRFKALSPNNSYFFAPQVYFYLRRADCDIIHAHNYHAFPALFAALAKKGRKLIFTPHYHGKGSSKFRNLLIKPYRFLGSLIFKKADAVICVSEYERKLVSKDFGVGAVVIPNGVDFEKIRKSKPFEFSDKLIFYMGRIERYKNICLLLEAMKYLDDFYFYIAGKGNFEREVRRSVERLGLEKKVKLLGFVDEREKYKWLKTCTVFVNISPIEAFGITVLEALACGKPVVINREGGLSEFASKFNCVFTVDSDVTPKELAEVIRMAAEIKADANLKEYDWRNIVEKTKQVYMSVEKKSCQRHNFSDFY